MHAEARNRRQRGPQKQIRLISFVIPVYRNAGTLRATHEKVTALFADRLKTYAYEFVFVDDGSDDGSLNELLVLRDDDSKVNVISFSRNFGQMAAATAGLKEAKGSAVVIMSADLQDPPEMIVHMVAAWEAGNTIVACEREDREDAFTSRVMSKLFYGLIRLSNSRMPLGGFDFVLVDRIAVDELNTIDERNRFFQGDILWLGYEVKYLPYKRLKRQVGESQWTLAKKAKYFIDGFLNTSYLSIRFMSLLGICVALVGFLYAVLVVYNRIIDATPFPGWAPIVILILIVGGLLMLMLGVIGEYVWRIYDETRGRAPYVIKKKYTVGVDEY